MLRRLAKHAVLAFEADVKKGLRNGLSADELTNEVIDDAGNEEDEGKSKIRGIQKRRTSGVKQAKIVRQQERVDPLTGKGRSKGYGFLEMHTHADALRAMRWANNNPDIGPLFETWWKEDLDDLVKAEKGKKKEEIDDARLKRMKEELEKGAEGKGRGKRGTLIVEFSIENVQVVKRRDTLQKERVSVGIFLCLSYHLVQRTDL